MDEKDITFGETNNSSDDNKAQNEAFDLSFSDKTAISESRAEREDDLITDSYSDSVEDTAESLDGYESEHQDEIIEVEEAEAEEYENEVSEELEGFDTDDTVETLDAVSDSDAEEVTDEDLSEEYMDDVPAVISEEGYEDDADDKASDEPGDIDNEYGEAEDSDESDGYNDEEYDEDYDDEYEEEDVPRKRNQFRRPSKKKKHKRAQSKVNNSIFGGLILVSIILTVSIILAITGVKLGFEYLGAGKSEEDVTFNIPQDANPDQIADILIANDIIENKTLFKLAMKMQHSPTLFPGDVTLNPAMGYAKVIETLSVQRDVRQTVKITFKEGITLLEAAKLLKENKVCENEQDFIFNFNKLQDFPFETMINTNADTFYKMEGYFFPDTYEFYIGDTGYNITRVIRSNFANKFDSSMQQKMKARNLTLDQVMILASMVQWEANSAADMPKVASVFLNRLAQPDRYPKLQSDATGNYLTKVINVVGDSASKEHYKELYDTYICDGLPVGPVCNPGLDAIKAVLDPANTNYYYFCNDLRTGESFFAETYEEHEKNLVKAGLK